jgi:hypothetical protein
VAGPDGGAQGRYGNGFLAERLAQQGAQPGMTDGPTTAVAATQVEAPAQGTPPSSGAGPQQRANPLPVQPGEQRRTVFGVTIVGTDVSPTALDSCEDFVEATLARRPDIQARMAKAKVTLVIIPRNRKMTDVPAFAGLRGTRTFDGRMWDDVRGSGGMATSAGWAIGVAEETLVRSAGAVGGYGEGTNVGLHELAHTIHAKGVTGEERKRITALYAARKKANGPWTESYGASNEQEYFAQSTNCFFAQNRGIGQNDPAWLRDNDPGMYALLVAIYGPPRENAVATDAGSAGGTPRA